MSTGIFIVGLIAGCALDALATFAYDRWKARKATAPAQKPAPAAIQPPPRNPPSPWQWRAMPCGTRMELGATGFYIRLAPDKEGAAYHGHTPEHFCCVRGNDLAAMKTYLEGEARERAEFEPQPVAWRRP